MAGTKEGGARAAKTNKEKYGEDFYKKIGRKGGKLGTTGGFAQRIKCECDYSNGFHYKSECAGSRGGKISRRTKKEI